MRLAETFGDFGFAIAASHFPARLGPAISPLNAFLIMNGIETLPAWRGIAKTHLPSPNGSNGTKVRVGQLCGTSGQPLHELAGKICPKARGPFSPSGKRGIRRRGETRFERGAVLPSCQHRRHAQPDHPSGLDHASPAHSGTARACPPPVMTWCVSRSGLEDTADIIADLEQAPCRLRAETAAQLKGAGCCRPARGEPLAVDIAPD